MKRGVAGVLVVLLVAALGVAGVAAVISGDDSSGPESVLASGPTASSTTTTRVEFSGDGAADYCAADQRLSEDLAANAPTSADPVALEAHFERQVAGVRELEGLAPDEIRADLTTTIGAYEALRPALAAVGWNPRQVSASDSAAIGTPEVVAAGRRLEQYRERVCGLVAEE